MKREYTYSAYKGGSLYTNATVRNTPDMKQICHTIKFREEGIDHATPNAVASQHLRAWNSIVFPTPEDNAEALVDKFFASNSWGHKRKYIAKIKVQKRRAEKRDKRKDHRQQCAITV